MFLASKLKESTPITGEQLVMYTDHSITLDDLTEMESLIITLLNWDLLAIVPNDFLDHVLHRMPLVSRIQFPIIKRHAQTFAALCATDCKFMQTPPSMIACCSIASAIKALKGDSTEDIFHLHVITGIDMDMIRACVEQVEQTVKTYMAAYIQSNPHTPTKQDPQKQEQPSTPTDVREINILAVDNSQVHHAVPVTM